VTGVAEDMRPLSHFRRRTAAPPECELEVAGIANGAPGGGAVAKHVTPGYQACNVIAGQVTPSGASYFARTVGLTCRGTPPAAGRAWVPGCRARTLPSVRPFYDGSAVLETPSP